MTHEKTVRAQRRVRICYFNTWADQLEDASAYLGRVGGLDLTSRIADPNDAALLQKARLDCDWYAENARCFARLEHPAIEFLAAKVCGPAGVLNLARLPREPGEERWLVTMAHQPQALGTAAGRVFALLAREGVRHCYYAFDEASRFMPCFDEIAPHLDILIHDESPLNASGQARLRSTARIFHRSWVANVVPFASAFNEEPEQRILFLGSRLGLTPHRERQIHFLRERFQDGFVAIHDHSVPVRERDALRRFRSASGGAIPLIGVGGIATADDAWERIRAGASLVQLYTAMVYEGPGIARRIANGLAERLKREGFANLAEAVGTERI